MISAADSAFGSDGQTAVPAPYRTLPASKQPQLVQWPTQWWAELVESLPRSTPLSHLCSQIQQIYLYRLPLRHNFRGIWERNGLLLKGPTGWSEFAPFWNYQPREAARWLLAGLYDATQTPPQTQQTKIPVNVTIPVVSPEEAAEIVSQSGGCQTAKIKIASTADSQNADIIRVSAVYQALKDSGVADPQIRVDINANWSYQEAREKLPALNRAAHGLQYAEQPCPDPLDLVKLRRDRICPLAADESIRRSPRPLQDLPVGAADVIIIKNQPLGGINAAVKVAQQATEQGIKTVFSSALDTVVGISHSLTAAAAATPTIETPLACGLATGQLFNGNVSPALADPHQVVDGCLTVGSVAVREADEILSLRAPLADIGERGDTWFLAQVWRDRLRLILCELEKFASPSEILGQDLN